jgi:hypothetical protein
MPIVTVVRLAFEAAEVETPHDLSPRAAGQSHMIPMPMVRPLHHASPQVASHGPPPPLRCAPQGRMKSAAQCFDLAGPGRQSPIRPREAGEGDRAQRGGGGALFESREREKGASSAYRPRLKITGNRYTLAFAVFAAVLGVSAPTASAAEMHKCDPPPEEGWSVVPERQVLSETDSAPYQAGPAGTWYVDRATTVLPFCHYFNAIGLYSLNSYSLAPVKSEERIAVCQPGEGGSVAVAPYEGRCPPK